MAPQDINRYSLFRDGEVDLPKPAPPEDPSKNPFLNQVAENPLPWQDVKKRGAPQGPLAVPARTLVIRDPNTPIITHRRTLSQQARSSAVSSATTTSDKPYDLHENWCGACSIRFPNKTALQNHVKQTPDHRHYCNLCVRVFKDRNGLKNHVDNTRGHKTFCNLCLSAFKDEWGLKNHFENNYAVDHQFLTGTVWKQAATSMQLILRLWKHIMSATTLGAMAANSYIRVRRSSISIKNIATCQYRARIVKSLALVKHMTKHTAAAIPCWGCSLPMRTFSSLINHLESGACPRFRGPSLLLQALGEWWYSPLFMDLDIHASIRTGRIKVEEVHEWMHAGILMPFICRDEGCKKAFGHLSAIVQHMESQVCGWDIERLNAPGLEALFKARCLRRDSGQE
ncbi:hypothetical protein E8E11_000530 [Didymella keratinophila]|nr:hypothetical protein E8E11_000530 [Didymella keratinophila]